MNQSPRTPSGPAGSKHTLTQESAGEEERILSSETDWLPLGTLPGTPIQEDTTRPRKSPHSRPERTAPLDQVGVVGLTREWAETDSRKNSQRGLDSSRVLTAGLSGGWIRRTRPRSPS